MSTAAMPRAFAVWFKDLERWDVKFFSSNLISVFPLEPLANFIREHNERVNLFEYPEEKFRILGVNNVDGIFLAYDTLGSRINQPYKKVSAKDFAYNPYRVNVGSIGLAPKELAGNYISPAYVVFSVDETKLLPEYLNLILKADWYNKTLRATTAGSVRQNLTFELLGTLKIPSPPLPVQQKIVNYWKEGQEKICQKKKTIDDIKSVIEKYFFDALGLKYLKNKTLAKCFTMQWADIVRWGVNHNQMKLISSDLTKGKYPVVKLGSILERMQYGTSEKASNTQLGTPILRIKNIKNGTIDYSDLKYIKLPQKSEQGLLLNKGDILIIRTSGSRELVGTCATFDKEDNFVYASYLIRLCIDYKKAIPEYTTFFVTSPVGRQQVLSSSRHIMQNNINTQEISELNIVLPPLNVQKEIMRHIFEKQKQMQKTKKEITECEQNLKKKIEAIILGRKKIEEIINGGKEEKQDKGDCSGVCRKGKRADGK
jgi:type I restriction enzyme S subunit